MQILEGGDEYKYTTQKIIETPSLAKDLQNGSLRGGYDAKEPHQKTRAGFSILQ